MNCAEVIDPSNPNAAPPGGAFLRAGDLSIVAGGSVLAEKISLTVRAPEFLAVMGPSGAGKTTFLRTLAGLQAPAFGSVGISLNGGSCMPPGSCRNELGLVFQHLRLAPNLSVLTSVLCGRLGREPWWKTLLGFSTAARMKALGLLQEFGLRGFECAPVGRLSGGEKQRVAIIRALMQEPAVLLADEPVSHLDARLSHRILEKLKQRAQLDSFLVSCVLHDESLAGEFADACLVISPALRNGWEWSFRTSAAEESHPIS